MKALIIKLTSMGDLMHALPALTEAGKNISNLEVDWVVDENFSDIPSWHPNIKEIITTNHRNWKKQIFRSASRKALYELKKKINYNNYDVVVDMQNNLKSAFISYLYKGKVHGLDRSSVREYPAHWSYSNYSKVSKKLHAIERQKILLSDALGYEYIEEDFDYGINKSKFIKPNIELPSKYAVLVHNASWPSKIWLIAYWQKLIKYFESKGISTLLPSGNKEELFIAKKISQNSPKSIALNLMSLNNIGYILDNAKICVCSDTGLAHLSAVVNTPSITLYGPTDVNLIGTKGKNQNHLIGKDNSITNILPNDVIKLIEEINI